MSQKDSAKTKKIKSLILDLRPGDVNRQLKAVKSLKVHGDHTVVIPLLDVLSNADDEKLRNEIIETLNSVKLTSVPPVIAKALGDDKYASIRQILLSSIWNSGLDYREYLADIIKAAVKGEMMDALECITIIENIEEELSEEHIMEAQLILNEYLVNHKDETSQKNEMLKEIALILQERNDLL